MLFKHTRIISRYRIIGEQTREGILSVLSEEELNGLLTEYREYIQETCKRAIASVHSFHESKKKSKEGLQLECLDHVEVMVGDELDYLKLVKSYSGNKLTHTEISTKTTGTKSVNVIVKDKYGQRITKTVIVNVKERK